MADSDEKIVSEEGELVKSPKKRKRKNLKRRNQKQAQQATQAAPQKKAKTESPKTPAIAPKDSSDSSSESVDAPAAKVTYGKISEAPEGTILDLGRDCHARTNKFNDNVYLDFRVYYTHKTTDKLMPGRKGISFTREQWNVLKNNIPMLDKAFAEAHKPASSR